MNFLQQLASRTYDQANMFDNGRTFKQRQATNDRSVAGQLTHNGVTNTAGNLLVKPAAATVQSGYNAGQYLADRAVGDQQAANIARQQLAKHYGGSIPGFFTNQAADVGRTLYYTPQAIAADVRGFQGKAPTAAQQQALNKGLSAFNRTTVGQMVSPAENAIAAAVPGAAERAAAAGYDLKATGAQKYFANPVSGALGTYGLLAGAKAGAEKVAPKAAAAKARLTPLNQVGAVGKNVQHLDSVNPTGKVFTKYDPQSRASAQLAENLTSLAKTSGKHEDELVTIYRGAPSSQKGIVAGDFITTNAQLAKDYAGTGKVISKKVRLGDVLDDKNEPLGEEYIYRPKQSGQVNKIAEALPAARKAGADDAQIRNILQEGVGSNRPSAARVLEQNQANLTIADRLALTGGDTGQAGLQLPAADRNAALSAFRQKAATSAAGEARGLTPLNERGFAQVPGRSPKQSKQLPAQSLEQSLPGSSVNPTAKVPLAKAAGSPVEQNSLTKGGKEGRQNLSPEVQGAISGEHVVRNTAALGERGQVAVDKMKLNDAINAAHERLAVKPGTITDEDVSFVSKAIERADAEGRPNDATALHDGLSEQLVANGQTSQAASLLYQRSPQGILYQAIRDLGRAGVEVTPELKARLQGLTDKIKGATNPLEKMDAVARFHKAVSKEMPQNLSDQLTSIWKAGLLSGVKTQGGNFVSNATFGGLRAVSNPLSAGIDNLISLKTGVRTKTATGRGLASGAKEGSMKGFKTLRTGIDERNYNGGKYEQHAEINFKNPVLQKVFGIGPNMVFRGMNAADQPFYYAALKNTLYDVAKADGLNKGLHGAQLRAYMNKTVQNPTPKMAEIAKAAADKSVLGYDTIASKAIQGIHSGIDKMQGDRYKVGRTVAHTSVNVLAPFVRVPTAYLARSLDYSPVGYVKAFTKAVVESRGAKGIDQRALSEALGEATTGTAVIFMGAALASKNLLSGAYPTDPKEIARWKAEKITPNSVKIGGTWRSLNYLGPAGLLINAGKDYHDALKRGDNAAVAAIAGAGKNLTQQSFLTGFSGFANAIQDPQQNFKNYINSEAGSVVPALSNDTANFFDNFQRETNNPVQSIKSRIPGARNTLPVKQDVYGNPLEQRSNRWELLLDPTRPSDSTTNNPVITEVSRLHAVDPNNADLQVTPVPVKKVIENGDQKIKLNNTQRHDLQKAVGQYTQQKWGDFIKTPEYQALSDVDKAAALTKLRQDAATVAQRQYISDNNLGTFAKAETAAQVNLGRGNSSLANYARVGGSNATGAQQITINSQISGPSKKILTQYNSLDPVARKKYFDSASNAEYNYDRAKYENDVASGNLTKADAARAQYGLGKSQIGSLYTKEVRDLYSLNKNELYNVITNDPNGSSLAAQLVQYGDQLQTGGYGNNKWRDRYGNVAFDPNQKSAGRGRGGSRSVSQKSAISSIGNLRGKVASSKVSGRRLATSSKPHGLQQYRKSSASGKSTVAVTKKRLTRSTA